MKRSGNPVMWLKVCGICSVEDGLAAAECGAQAIGLNFVPPSPRCLSVELGARIATALRGSVEVIGVVADLGIQQMLSLKEKVGLDTLQLHGAESSGDLAAVGPRAYKALRVASAEDVALADRYEGDRLLVDAKVTGVLGGSGHAFDWSLVVALAKRRSIVLAGGLHEGNVAEAVRTVAPWGLDVASGVEVVGEPRRKDPAKLRRFVAAAHAAAARLPEVG
ncbi:MAG: phosphoribosylanthranilate isomerase [Polyangiaceae bacterium]|nr:phosphoribosylanthranilate isomerase [Polyangiaceae bacterium]